MLLKIFNLICIKFLNSVSIEIINFKVKVQYNGKNYYKNQDGSIKIKENNKNTSNYRTINLNSGDKNCPICYEDIIKPDDIAVSINPCGHIFHKKCITKYYEIHIFCNYKGFKIFKNSTSHNYRRNNKDRKINHNSFHSNHNPFHKDSINI